MTEKRKINFNINKKLLASFDVEASKQGLTRTALLTVLINNYLNNERRIKNEK